jgi:two-component system, OmpR family, sensor histidine kinase PrrB
VNRPLSIRTRATIAATAAVALVLIVGGVFTVATFAQRERSSLDRELERRAQGPALRARALRPALRPEGRRGEVAAPPPHGGLPGEGGPGLLAESGAFVRVISDGSVVEAAGDVPEDGFPIPEKVGLETIEAGGRKWRTLTAELPPPPPGAPESLGRGQVQFATDLEPVEDRIGEMRTRVALISALGIVLAATLASLLSGLALGPLSRLRRAVAGITGTRDLSRRLPDSGAAAEVDELARSVNAMLTRLERSAAETEHALEATRRFAADVGHELRTPLTSIRANLDAVRRNPSMPDERRQGILDEVAKEQRGLVALLDALQALARGDAGTALPQESLDFAEIVDAAVEAARRRHPEASIDLEGPEDRQELNGWPDGLRLLVENLIENAVRHGGSRVQVVLSRDGAAGPLLLTVDDNGPGVPAHERMQIFERFTRGSAAKAPGSGLGLALVAQQAALHGGAVEVGESSAGGARFTVRLPGAAES